MNAPNAERAARPFASSTWTIPLILAVCTAIALGVGLLYDGIWDIIASALLAVPVLSFLERFMRRPR